MQWTGYIIIDEIKILVLVRQKKYSRLLKLRKTGRPGVHLIDEEKYLEGDRQQLKSLLAGKVVDL